MNVAADGRGRLRGRDDHRYGTGIGGAQRDAGLIGHQGGCRDESE